ncbi:hypothetical protein Esti_003661 [Eimeria stiedai]
MHNPSMGVCRRLNQLPLALLLLFLFSGVVARLPVFKVVARPSSKAWGRPCAPLDERTSKPFLLQHLTNCQNCFCEARLATGCLPYPLRGTVPLGLTRDNGFVQELSCQGGLGPNIGFLLANTSLRPALSGVGWATRADRLVEQGESYMCSRSRLQSRKPPKSPLCALPRTVRASRLIMPSAEYAEWDLSGASQGQTDKRGVSRRSGCHSDYRVSLNAEAATSLPELAQNDEAIDRQWCADNKSAAAAASGRLLERARLLQSAASGLFCVLPLGVRVMKKIEAICHEELEMAGATPLSLPNVMPLKWISGSKRLTSFGSSLYRLHDRRGRELFLPPTSEEAAAWLAATNIRSHRDLPLVFYQIGQKFRDELRPRAGCLRAREFVMLEAYSFHQNAACREVSYYVMDKCFRRILARVGAAPVHRVEADPGTMGGRCSHEYHVPSLLGEDVTLQGPAARGAENSDRAPEVALGQACGPMGRSLEVGHCFQLPATYCEAAKARFADSSGAVKVPLMNSYGLGVSRLFGHLALAHQDAKGLRFPQQVAPFSVAVLLQSPQRWNASRSVTRVGEAFFKKIGQFANEAGGSADTLLDDRRGITLRHMQAHADLVGIPHQILVKEELLKPPGPARVLYVERSSGRTEVQTLRTALRAIKKALLHLAAVSQAESMAGE